MAVASMVLGIIAVPISLLAFCLWWASGPLGLMAVIFGHVALPGRTRSGQRGRNGAGGSDLRLRRARDHRAGRGHVDEALPAQHVTRARWRSNLPRPGFRAAEGAGTLLALHHDRHAQEIPR